MEFYRIISVADDTVIPDYYNTLFVQTNYNADSNTLTKVTAAAYMNNKYYHPIRAYIADITDEDRTHLKLIGVDVCKTACIFTKRLLDVYTTGRTQQNFYLQ